MGMGKGSSKYGGNRGGGGGRLPYGIMLILAFGAAVFGVMVLHKFRERRIFNILIKDKDTHILTLQLLLQKEKDYTKELKKKIEEMKTKAFSLRTQKVELNNKIMDMQSLISSLKEEGKALESELEEKRNEIIILRNIDIDSTTESSQVSALTELLKQKEAEIEDMKSRLENLVHVWSVSTDDPSKPDDSLSAKATNVVEKSIEESEKAVNAKDGEVLVENSQGGIGNATEGIAQIEVQEKKLQYTENQQDGEGLRNAEEIQERRETWDQATKEKPDDSHNADDFRMSGEKGSKNETEEVESSREDQVLKTKVEDADKKPLVKESEDASDQDLKIGLGDFAGKKLEEVFRNRRLELPENSKYDEGLKTGTSSDDQVGSEVNEDTTMVSSSDGKLEENQQTENSNEAGETDSNQAMLSLDGHHDDSVTKETNAADSNQQKKPNEPEDQPLEENAVQNATDNEELPATHPMKKIQRLHKRTKGQRIRNLPRFMLVNNQ